eukprot:m.113175 g.113175  ORF g.113175 m.113175 type:complete len:373 (-) comp13009_c0_seq5:174-1292(-)
MSGAACGKLKSSPTLILRPGRAGVGGDGGADFDAGHLHFQPHRDLWQPKAQDAGSATMLVRASDMTPGQLDVFCRELPRHTTTANPAHSPVLRIRHMSGAHSVPKPRRSASPRSMRHRGHTRSADPSLGLTSRPTLDHCGLGSRSDDVSTPLSELESSIRAMQVGDSRTRANSKSIFPQSSAFGPMPWLQPAANTSRDLCASSHSYAALGESATLLDTTFGGDGLDGWTPDFSSNPLESGLAALGASLESLETPAASPPVVLEGWLGRSRSARGTPGSPDGCMTPTPGQTVSMHGWAVSTKTAFVTAPMSMDESEGLPNIAMSSLWQRRAKRKGPMSPDCNNGVVPGRSRAFFGDSAHDQKRMTPAVADPER